MTSKTGSKKTARKQYAHEFKEEALALVHIHAGLLRRVFTSGHAI